MCMQSRDHPIQNQSELHPAEHDGWDRTEFEHEVSLVKLATVLLERRALLIRVITMTTFIGVALALTRTTRRPWARPAGFWEGRSSWST